MTVSFIMAVLIPWVLGGLVYSYDTLLSIVSVVSIALTVLVTFVSPIFFYYQCVVEASHFEVNFRLSLKQMYDGDRLSKKETSILPKTNNLDPNFDTATGFASTCAGHTEISSCLIRVDGHTKAEAFNTPGTVKWGAYPTTLMLRQSQ